MYKRSLRSVWHSLRFIWVPENVAGVLGKEDCCGARKLTAEQHLAAEMKMKRLVALEEANWAQKDSETERSDNWDEMSKEELEDIGMDKRSASRELKLIEFWRRAATTMREVAQAFGDAVKAYRGKAGAPGVQKTIAKKAAPPDAATKAVQLLKKLQKSKASVLKMEESRDMDWCSSFC